MPDFAAPRRFAFMLVALCLLALGGHVRAQDTTPIPSLAEQVGFDDPMFAQLEAQGQTVLADNVSFPAYGHSYRLLSVWQLSDGFEFPVSGTALLYQTDGTPKLLWKRDNGNGQWPQISGQGVAAFSAPPPGDWDQDGRVEFGMYEDTPGTTWAASVFYLYQLEPDGTVVDLLQNRIPPGNIVVAAEAQPEGTVLLTALDISGELTMGLANCCGPRIARYFTWQNGALTDTSAKYAARYMQPLGAAIYAVTTQQILDGAEFSARLLEILEMYEAIGQKDAGWLLVQNLVTQAKASGRLQDGTYVDTVFLPTITRLYESDQPFVVPDYVGPNAAAPEDFYAPTH